MGVLLEINAGPFAGKNIALVTGRVGDRRTGGRARAVCFATRHVYVRRALCRRVRAERLPRSGSQEQQRHVSQWRAHSGRHARERRRNQRRANNFRGENCCRRETCVLAAARRSCGAARCTAAASRGRTRNLALQNRSFAPRNRRPRYHLPPHGPQRSRSPRRTEILACPRREGMFASLRQA